MATTKNITMKQFNGSDYDTLYPKTQGSQIIGTIPIASGGTGGTTAKAGMYNLLNGMSAIAPATNDLFPFKDVSGSTSGLVTLSNLITAMGNNGVITTSNLSTQASNLGFSKIQTGSYVGTGTYGQSNPCSLTFDFSPKGVWISNSSNSSAILNPLVYGQTGAIFLGTRAGIILTVNWNNNTVKYYTSDSAESQLNISGQRYYYIGIG